MILVASVIVTSDSAMMADQVKAGFRRVHLPTISETVGGLALIGRFSKCARKSSANSWAEAISEMEWRMVGLRKI